MPTVVVPAPANSVVVSGLVNGQLYNVTVTARNAVGSGPVSAVVQGTPVASSFGLAQVIASMQTANIDFPFNFPSSFSQYFGPQYEGLPPGSWVSGTPWGWVWPNRNFGSPPADPANTSVQCRNMYEAYWSNSRQAWVFLIQTSLFSGELNDINAQLGSQGSFSFTDQSANGGGGSFVPPTANGQIVQFYPSFTLAHQTYPAGDVGAAYTEFQARIIKTNPAGPDNRAQAHYVAGGGGDWYNIPGAGATLNNMANGAFQAIPNDGTWRTFVTWSGPSGFNPTWPNTPQFPAGWTVAQLTQHPPPISAMGPPV